MPFLEEQNKKIVKEAIKKAEAITSGEIRVCVEKHCKEDVLDRAAYYFKQLEMHKTSQRNGVLIYLATEDRKFAIIGDVGINMKIDFGFWHETKEVMLAHFKQGLLIEGLVKGIEKAGNALGQFFPPISDNKNELSDDIYFGNE
ncbi:TPM domain-containing protein [Solitalea sp. MAHUQ-68]|uniref:TPM domain-containing protein n=1 Tax=Solitalea agri TaxID=2953739 RepID=A0A9X2JD57_9SPHI|nr:TPM domain-containing protein [Solitalea agri]MCO4293259.1 TPM domain-containing protein [Solitalea agri]